MYKTDYKLFKVEMELDRMLSAFLLSEHVLAVGSVALEEMQIRIFWTNNKT